MWLLHSLQQNCLLCLLEFALLLDLALRDFCLFSFSNSYIETFERFQSILSWLINESKDFPAYLTKSNRNFMCKITTFLVNIYWLQAIPFLLMQSFFPFDDFAVSRLTHPTIFQLYWKVWHCGLHSSSLFPVPKLKYEVCYRSKLFLGYSIFKLVYCFQTRSICLNLGQFFSN